MLLAGPCSVLPPRLYAGTPVFVGSLVDDTSIAIDRNYDLDVTQAGIDRLSFVANYSTTTAAVKTFTDGQKSTGTITMSTTSLTGYTVWLNGVRWAAGVDWTPVATTTGCAKALSDAIMASVSSATFVSTWTASVVVCTATTVGVNAYEMATSTPFGMRLNLSSTARVAAFLNGAVSSVDPAADTIITASNHGYGTGFAVWLGTGGFTTPGNLSNGTTYYAIKVNNNQLKLATTKANAVLGTGIDLTTLAGGGTFSLNPVVMPATTGSGFRWQASNDNSTFVDLSVSSITVIPTLTSGTTSWDLGTVNYRYYRFKYLTPAQGGANMTLTGNGIKN